MTYSTNPNLPKARAIAMQLLIRDGLPLQVVANRCGVHRSTIWRWKRKWDELNAQVQFTNDNRPTRAPGATFRLSACSWRIPTLSSRPRTSPRAIAETIVQQVLAVRRTLRRCAEVVWHHLTTVLGVLVSLSSVRRILRRAHCFDRARKPRVRRDNPRRPLVTQPGELVQIDTIHHVDPYSGKRLYYYTVIDLYTRMTHVTMSTSLRQGLAVSAILEAERVFGFSFAMV
jgi:transposase-like protein